ncbi:MAG: 50S ribosomal protein L22, partial [bacterium]
MEIKAILKYCRLSARKARLVADQVRGMEAEKAVSLLEFGKQKGTGIIGKLLKSAIANASQQEEVSPPPFAVVAAFEMKRVRQRGKFTIDLNKYTSDSITLRFD